MRYSTRVFALAAATTITLGADSLLAQGSVRWPHDVLVGLPANPASANHLGALVRPAARVLLTSSPETNHGVGRLYLTAVHGPDLAILQVVDSTLPWFTGFSANAVGDERQVFVSMPYEHGPLGLFEGRVALARWDSAGRLVVDGLLHPTVYKPAWSSGLALSQDELFVTANGNQPLLQVFRRPVTPTSTPIYEFTPPPGIVGGRFGDGIAVHGDWLAVGHPRGYPQSQSGLFSSGRVEVFHRDPAGDWHHHCTLTASPPRNEGYFGNSLLWADDGHSLFIGESGLSLPGSPVGRLHRFERDPAGAFTPVDLWTWQHGGFAQNFFGWSLALQGDRLYVGVPGVSSEALGNGAVVVYERSGATWTEAERLSTPYTPGQESLFGNNVAVVGDAVVVGAPFEYGQDGALFLFLPPLGDAYCSQPGGTLTLEAAGTRADQARGLHLYLRHPETLTAVGLAASLAPAVPPISIGNGGHTLCVSGAIARARRSRSFTVGPLTTSRFSIADYAFAPPVLAGATLYAQGFALDGAGGVVLSNAVRVP